MTGIARIAVLLLLVSVGCVEDTTSTEEQSICTIEDQEAGHCTLRQLTRDVGRSRVPPGSGPVFETYGVCDSFVCLVRIELPNLVITAACVRNPDGTVSCGSATCVPGNCPHG